MGKKNSFGSLIVCRKPFEEFLPDGRMTSEARINNVADGGPRIGIFCAWPFGDFVFHDGPSQKVFKKLMPFFATRRDYDERFLVTFLSLLARGQITLDDCPRLYESALEELSDTD